MSTHVLVALVLLGPAIFAAGFVAACALVDAVRWARRRVVLDDRLTHVRRGLNRTNRSLPPCA